MDVFAVFCRDENYRRPGDKTEFASEFGDQKVAFFFAAFQEVDFVDCDDQALFVLEDVLDDMGILGGDPFVAID